MKLHEALRQIITQFGVSVLGEKRLVYLLSDYRAFEDYPAMRQIMLLIAGKDCLNGLASKGKAVSRREAERAARDLRKHLVKAEHVRPEFADYAAGSVLFALGITDSLSEPLSQSFDPHDLSAVPGQGNPGPVQKPGSGQRRQGAGRPFIWRTILIIFVLAAGGFGIWHFRDSIPLPGIWEEISQYLRHDPAYSDYAGAKAPGGDAKRYLKSAKQGDADAQASLGSIYYRDGNFREAAVWLQRAAERGDSYARTMLGAMYAEGQGVTQDYAEAVKWWRRGAAEGDPAAETLLGIAIANGRGAQQDYAEAIRLWKKASAHGNAGSQALLGNAYQKGLGVRKDPSEAARWLKAACRNGRKDACRAAASP